MNCDQLIKLYKSKKRNENLPTLFNELMSLDGNAVLDLRFYKLLKDVSELYGSQNAKYTSIKDTEKAYILVKKRVKLYQDQSSYWDLAHFYLTPKAFTEKCTYGEIIELAKKTFKEKGLDIIPSVERILVYDGEAIHYQIKFYAQYNIRCFLLDSKEKPRDKILIESYKDLTEKEVYSLIRQEKMRTRRGTPIADNYKDPLKEIENMFFSIQKEFIFPIVRLKLNSENNYWGICYPDKKLISLSKNLINRSKEFIHYVIIHEYCHLYYANHSKNFWREVAMRCPEYRQYEEYYKRIY